MQIKLVQISLKCWVIIGYTIYRFILVPWAHRSINKCSYFQTALYSYINLLKIWARDTLLGKCRDPTFTKCATYHQRLLRICFWKTSQEKKSGSRSKEPDQAKLKKERKNPGLIIEVKNRKEDVFFLSQADTLFFFSYSLWLTKKRKQTGLD